MGAGVGVPLPAPQARAAVIAYLLAAVKQGTEATGRRGLICALCCRPAQHDVEVRCGPSLLLMALPSATLAWHAAMLGCRPEHLQDLLTVSWRWFASAQRHHAATAAEPSMGSQPEGASPPAAHGSLPSPRHAPHQRLSHFLLWNSGQSAGASQPHAHAQLLSTTVPVAAQMRLDAGVPRYNAEDSDAAPGASAPAWPGPGRGMQLAPRCYYTDLVAAHAALGLARCVAVGEDRCAWACIP